MGSPLGKSLQDRPMLPCVSNQCTPSLSLSLHGVVMLTGGASQSPS